MIQKKVIHAYEEAKALLAKTEKSLEICIENQKEKIPKQLRHLEEQLAALTNKVEAFKQQLNAVIDAEREIKRQIEKMMRIHKSDLEEALAEVY